MERAPQELAQGLEWGVVAVLRDRVGWEEIELALVRQGIAFAQNAESV
jgi:hypothetical protein